MNTHSTITGNISTVYTTDTPSLISNHIADIKQQQYDILYRLDELENENVFLKLRLLKLEGVYTEREFDNLACMLKSPDSASSELAKHIIKNA